MDKETKERYTRVRDRIIEVATGYFEDNYSEIRPALAPKDLNKPLTPREAYRYFSNISDKKGLTEDEVIYIEEGTFACQLLTGDSIRMLVAFTKIVPLPKNFKFDPNKRVDKIDTENLGDYLTKDKFPIKSYEANILVDHKEGFMVATDATKLKALIVPKEDKPQKFVNVDGYETDMKSFYPDWKAVIPEKGIGLNLPLEVSKFLGKQPKNPEGYKIRVCKNETSIELLDGTVKTVKVKNEAEGEIALMPDIAKLIAKEGFTFLHLSSHLALASVTDEAITLFMLCKCLGLKGTEEYIDEILR